jgi:hypothetical protein
VKLEFDPDVEPDAMMYRLAQAGWISLDRFDSVSLYEADKACRALGSYADAEAAYYRSKAGR